MRVIAFIENTRIPQRRDLRTGPGLALCIRAAEKQILFDTGIVGALLANAQRLNVDITQVDLAVISHHPVDHGGGLRAGLGAKNHSEIFLKSSRTPEFLLDLLGLTRQSISPAETLFQEYPERFTFINVGCEIASKVCLLTQIDQRHPMPKGNPHLQSNRIWISKSPDFPNRLERSPSQ